MRKQMQRWVVLVTLAAAVSVMFGSLAWSQDRRYDDDDYYRRDDARGQGYRNGYRDGVRVGQSDAERGRRFKFKNDDWEDSRGYEHWMGNHAQYKQAYRDGYEHGYRKGYGYYGRRDGDRDDYRGRDRDDWR